MTRRTAFIFNSHAGRGFDAGWLDTHRGDIEAIAAGGPISLVEDGGQIRAAVQAALAQGCEAVVPAAATARSMRSPPASLASP